jgi:signal transduction histidine kinase
VLGVLRVYAAKEIPTFETSNTKRYLDNLDSVLGAISTLRRAAAPAKPQQVDLAELIDNLLAREALNRSVQLQTAGPRPCLAVTDSALLSIVVTNGLRNAVESTEACAPELTGPVIINWGATDVDYWISIIDHGRGIQASIDRVFEVGSSSKPGHLGMGLPTARQAARSLHGDVWIAPRKESGVAFEVRWPKNKANAR